MTTLQSPTPFRRPSSAVTVKNSCVTNNRPRTAHQLPAYKQIYIMPRTHISVARFCDWSSDLGECMSVSQLYQVFSRSKTVPSSPRLSLTKKEWLDRTPRLHPLTGRMFIKDKTASLTKGEREIIDGIWRNRSLDPCDDPVVLRHSEAWSVGKSASKPRLKYIHAHLTTDLNQLKYDKHNAFTESSVMRGCGICSNCEHANGNAICREKTVLRGDNQGVKAPPSTPEKSIKPEKVPPINNGNGAVVLEQVHSNSSEESKPKMYLNIFLPKMQPDIGCEEHRNETNIKPKQVKNFDTKHRKAKLQK